MENDLAQYRYRLAIAIATIEELNAAKSWTGIQVMRRDFSVRTENELRGWLLQELESNSPQPGGEASLPVVDGVMSLQEDAFIISPSN